jgi:hypothetical protein
MPKLTRDYMQRAQEIIFCKINNLLQINRGNVIEYNDDISKIIIYRGINNHDFVDFQVMYEGELYGEKIKTVFFVEFSDNDPNLKLCGKMKIYKRR